MPLTRPRTLLLAALAPIAAATAHAEAPTLETRLHAGYGRYLTDADGRSLYTFSADSQGDGAAQPSSACRDACAKTFPPLTAGEAPVSEATAAAGAFSLFQRDQDGQQVAYQGRPLYRFVGDSGQGQATAHGMKQFGGKWQLAAVDGQGNGSEQDVASLFQGLQLEKPECVRYDAERDRYLISNINGKMRGADDNGFITVVAGSGLTERKWISGGRDGVALNAPKGMELHDGRLLVADIDHLRVFDAETGRAIGSVHLQGALFLNDLAVADDGTVYVTDSGTKKSPGAIYRIGGDGTVAKIAGRPELARPNGIDFAADGSLVVVTFGGNSVMRVSRDGEVLERTKLDAGQLDGLLVREDGTRLVSSWKGKHLIRLAPDGTSEVIATGLVQPACFELNEARSLLLVPEVKANRIAVLPLGGG